VLLVGRHGDELHEVLEGTEVVVVVTKKEFQT
jgi:hypothetical protein